MQSPSLKCTAADMQKGKRYVSTKLPILGFPISWYTLPTASRQWILSNLRAKELKGRTRSREMSVLLDARLNPTWVLMYINTSNGNGGSTKYLLMLPPDTNLLEVFVSKPVPVLVHIPESEPISNPIDTNTPINVCLCGCGTTARRRFLPGHDAKLKRQLRIGTLDSNHPAHQLEQQLRKKWSL